jgi:hypothetical protein
MHLRCVDGPYHAAWEKRAAYDLISSQDASDKALVF